MSPTCCVPPLFIAEVCFTPFLSSHAQSSGMPTTLGLCFFAISTASPMWSPCPCVHSRTSTAFTSFSLAGQTGLPITQGSTRIVLPFGVWRRKVSCPSQEILMPFSFFSRSQLSAAVLRYRHRQRNHSSHSRLPPSISPLRNTLQ